MKTDKLHYSQQYSNIHYKLETKGTWTQLHIERITVNLQN